MIELKINVSNVDYDAVIRLLGGGGTASNAFSMLTGILPDGVKEEFAVDLINSNAGELASMLESAAAERGIRLNLSGAKASIKDRE